jgi:hypothetical protein
MAETPEDERIVQDPLLTPLLSDAESGDTGTVGGHRHDKEKRLKRLALVWCCIISVLNAYLVALIVFYMIQMIEFGGGSEFEVITVEGLVLFLLLSIIVVSWRLYRGGRYLRSLVYSLSGFYFHLGLWILK